MLGGGFAFLRFRVFGLRVVVFVGVLGFWVYGSGAA